MAATAPLKCPRCGHKAHTEECQRLGRVECRVFPRPQGDAWVRGRFPCGCPPPRPAAGA